MEGLESGFAALGLLNVSNDDSDEEEEIDAVYHDDPQVEMGSLNRGVSRVSSLCCDFDDSLNLTILFNNSNGLTICCKKKRLRTLMNTLQLLRRIPVTGWKRI